jgi:GNAT superfamily N-acetyltransferase
MRAFATCQERMPARNLQFRHSRAICGLRSRIFLASGVLATAAGACIGGLAAPTAEGARKTTGCYETSSVAVPRLVCLLSTGNLAVGWCQLTPRDAIPWLEHMWWFQRVDALPVWSISCFFVRRSYRRQCAMTHLVFAALKAAKRAGAAALDAYPIDTDVPNSTLNTFTGTVATVARAGFKEVARRAPARPIMRHDLKVIRAVVLHAEAPPPSRGRDYTKADPLPERNRRRHLCRRSRPAVWSTATALTRPSL